MLRLDAEGERLVNEGTYQDIINKINAMAGSMRVVHGDLVQMFVIALINNGNDWMALKLFNHFKHRYSDAGYQKRQILLLAACLGRLDTLRRLFRCGFKYTSPTISDLPGSILTNRSVASIAQPHNRSTSISGHSNTCPPPLSFLTTSPAPPPSSRSCGSE